MSAKDGIVKLISEMSGKYSAYTIFSDWVECCALAIQNGCCLFHDKLWMDREKQYINLINKYDERDRKKFQIMFALLSVALEECIEDVLGDVYMKAGCGSKQLGQFFTPFHLSRLTAILGLQDDDGNRIIDLNEPSCGGGGMIIGAASALAEKGVDYQRRMRVVAQDLDWHGVYMTYVQLSLLGIDAEVVQGDTLVSPYDPNNYSKDRIFKTPRRMGAIM